MLELNKIYTGNNLEIFPQIDDSSIDLHIHSPPYSNMKCYDNFSGIHPDNYVNWFMPFVFEIERTLKNTGSWILNINDKVVNRFRHPFVFELITEIHKRTGLKLFERLFWNKGKYLPHPSRFGDKVEYLFWFVKTDNFYFNIDKMRRPYTEISIKRMQKPIKKRFNRNNQNQNADEYREWKPNILGALPSTLIDIGSESQRVSDKHFAVFPLKLVEYFINGSTKEGDLVCDIFNGTGTSCLAAKKLKRNYIGIDISKEYCEEAKKRIETVDNKND